MDELAREAGISKRTLYRYFRSKDEIIEASLDRFIGEIDVKFEELIALHLEAKEIFPFLLNILRQVGGTIGSPLVMDDLRQHYPQYWKKIDDFRMEKAQRLISMLLEENTNGNSRGLDPRIVTQAVLASVQAVANPEFILSNGFSFEDTIKQLMDFFQYGFMKQPKSH